VKNLKGSEAIPVLSYHMVAAALFKAPLLQKLTCFLYSPQQAASLFLICAIKIAQAQPTPDLTDNAEKGQFLEQAPHSMHKSRSRILALPFSITNTL